MNDLRLREAVREELDYEPSLDASDIGVMASGGVVTLSGHVASYAQKIAAEQATWRVDGVQAIAQRIEVHLPGETKLSDDEVARRALNTLAWDVLVPSEKLHLKVADGWITLSGEVAWHYQREAAEAAVRKLAGLTGVSNHILVQPHAEPGNVHKLIADALKRHAEVEADRIEVDVQPNGTVAIEGHVGGWKARRAVERAAWSAPGVRAVDNRVRIA